MADLDRVVVQMPPSDVRRGEPRHLTMQAAIDFETAFRNRIAIPALTPARVSNHPASTFIYRLRLKLHQYL